MSRALTPLKPNWWKVLIVIIIIAFPFYVNILDRYWEDISFLENNQLLLELISSSSKPYLLTWLVISAPFKPILEPLGMWEIDSGIGPALTLPLTSGMHVISITYAILFYLVASWWSLYPKLKKQTGKR